MFPNINVADFQKTCRNKKQSLANYSGLRGIKDFSMYRYIIKPFL